MHLLARNSRVLVVCASILLASHTASADDAETELGWTTTGELSVLLTEGNTETSSFGLNLGALRTWEDARFELKLGGLMVDTTTSTRRAVGTPDSFQLIESSNSATTAENYHLKGRYDRDLSERMFWYAGAGWERNEFAGFDNRYSVIGGFGHVWRDDDSARFSTFYGLTWTKQDDIIENPTVADDFGGFQLGWDYWRQLSGNTAFDSDLVIDGNLDESEDLRADFLNSVTVSMNDTLALKVSLHLLWDNLPALTAVPLEDSIGLPTGLAALVELDDLDAILTVGVVFTR